MMGVIDYETTNKIFMRWLKEAHPNHVVRFSHVDSIKKMYDGTKLFIEFQEYLEPHNLKCLYIGNRDNRERCIVGRTPAHITAFLLVNL